LDIEPPEKKNRQSHKKFVVKIPQAGPWAQPISFAPHNRFDFGQPRSNFDRLR
jgi:hypothetical protein